VPDRVTTSAVEGSSKQETANAEFATTDHKMKEAHQMSAITIKDMNQSGRRGLQLTWRAAHADGPFVRIGAARRLVP
jgi:hypothetical protein